VTSRRPLAVAAALGIVYVVWGSTYLGIALAIETMPPLLMSAGRFLIAGAILYAITSRGAARPTARQWLWATATGVPLLALGNGGVTWAQQTVPSGIASLLVATVPLWIVLLDRLVWGRRLGWQSTAGIGVGFAGVALLVRPGGSEDVDVVGAVVLLLAAVFWATGTLLSRSAGLPPRPLQTAGMQMLAGGSALVVGGLVAGEAGEVRLAETSLESVLALVYLIVFGSIVAFTAYQWLLRTTRTSLVATYAYVNPVVAVALGWVWLDESITGRTLLAGGIILAAVALIVSARTPLEQAPARSSLRGWRGSADRSRAEAATPDTSRPRRPARAAPAPSGPSRPR
jgi:drug/metabolite transporter (DMT)-like permease